MHVEAKEESLTRVKLLNLPWKWKRKVAGNIMRKKKQLQANEKKKKGSEKKRGGGVLKKIRRSG